jgi:hypothetical protein
MMIGYRFGELPEQPLPFDTNQDRQRSHKTTVAHLSPV